MTMPLRKPARLDTAITGILEQRKRQHRFRRSKLLHHEAGEGERRKGEQPDDRGRCPCQSVTTLEEPDEQCCDPRGEGHGADVVDRVLASLNDLAQRHNHKDPRQKAKRQIHVKYPAPIGKFTRKPPMAGPMMLDTPHTPLNSPSIFALCSAE